MGKTVSEGAPVAKNAAAVAASRAAYESTLLRAAALALRAWTAADLEDVPVVKLDKIRRARLLTGKAAGRGALRRFDCPHCGERIV